MSALDGVSDQKPQDKAGYFWCDHVLDGAMASWAWRRLSPFCRRHAVPLGKILYQFEVAHSHYIKAPARRITIIQAGGGQASYIQETATWKWGQDPPLPAG